VIHSRGRVTLNDWGGQQEKPKKDTRDRPMTYRIGEELIARINEMAGLHNVEKSSLVKLLLSYSLDALETGDLELPLPEKRRKIDL